MSGLIWIQTVGLTDGISERIFCIVDFKKKSADDKNMQNYPACRELTGSFVDTETKDSPGTAREAETASGQGHAER